LFGSGYAAIENTLGEKRSLVNAAETENNLSRIGWEMENFP
jgi:hypothetical protein